MSHLQILLKGGPRSPGGQSPSSEGDGSPLSSSQGPRGPEKTGESVCGPQRGPHISSLAAASDPFWGGWWCPSSLARDVITHFGGHA